jgi:hypothetical protein
MCRYKVHVVSCYGTDVYSARQACFTVSRSHWEAAESRRQELALILRDIFKEADFRFEQNSVWTLCSSPVQVSLSTQDSLMTLDEVADQFVQECDSHKIRLPITLRLCMEYEW